ncbi:Uric acid degradation bifunctional protein PucL [Pseudobythopirellula maris]|uniref:2-oxo-4-hydroxy-4-carboxy-5-ureidoimidazoline decarboxylase n=1 Tax=Pseudobythopirellula maris TaxID=2527991 RepID=A0A5C5ZKA8_9BACT|nr:2-oxo-4-hydroxy-4-carboxy-5-ureidoimidazoline decarboxylase [Pseudobythopirellula maris]TWT87636.1 Uric acid degradation bifunctional protein PucL [Pseudobythopirellula maris]
MNPVHYNQLADHLNKLGEADARETLRGCCGAEGWIDRVLQTRPFADGAALDTAVERAFAALTRDDWLGAFACHPKIGDLGSLRMKYAGNKQWSAGEQAGVAEADERVIQRLAAGNAEYENRFGWIFIVCASGKSAAEMLGLLESRLGNEPEIELPIAAAEQKKITRLRLEKMGLEDKSIEKPAAE